MEQTRIGNTKLGRGGPNETAKEAINRWWLTPEWEAETAEEPSAGSSSYDSADSSGDDTEDWLAPRLPLDRMAVASVATTKSWTSKDDVRRAYAAGAATGLFTGAAKKGDRKEVSEEEEAALILLVLQKEAMEVLGGLDGQGNA
jgi:hypothetical protein